MSIGELLWQQRFIDVRRRLTSGQRRLTSVWGKWLPSPLGVVPAWMPGSSLQDASSSSLRSGSRHPCRDDAQGGGQPFSPGTQQGMVLVMTLLYLSVVTLLVMSAFEVSTLQIKMAANLSEQASAFQNAEAALIAGEAAVQGTESAGQGQVSAEASYRFSRRSESTCGVSYYQINATGTNAKAKTELESILLVPLAGDYECPNKIPERGEVAWQQLL